MSVAAMPPGARKGLVGLGASPGRKLHNRLREHAGSIVAVRSLTLEDFRCRYLIVDDIWIPLAERLLIGHRDPQGDRRLQATGELGRSKAVIQLAAAKL
jgi:hypothetical protein